MPAYFKISGVDQGFAKGADHDEHEASSRGRACSGGARIVAPGS